MATGAHARSSEPLAMDELLNGHWRTYSLYRATLSYALACVWLVAFPMYVDIYTMQRAEGSTNQSGDTCIECEDSQVICSPASGAIESFGLQCEPEVTLRLPSMFVIIGILIGALIGGSLSDRIGRRRTLLLAMTLQTISSIVAAFVPVYHAYLALRLVCGIGMSAVTQAAYTLSAEVVGPRYRTVLTIELFAYNWAAMSCLLSLLAFVMRDTHWRRFQLVLAAPQLLLSLALLVLSPESPRWLHGHGRTDEARRVLLRLLGDKELSERECMRSCGEQGSSAAPEGLVAAEGGAATSNGAVEHPRTDAPSAELQERWQALRRVKRLFSTCAVARVTLSEMVLWGACTLAFYGVQFNAVNLDPDRFYLNEFLVSLPQVPATFICARAIDCPTVGRRLAVSLMLWTTAAALFMATWVSSFAVAGSMLATFMATGAFNAVYVQVAELYPTSVRNTALGMCSAFARVTSMASSLLPSLMGSDGSLLLIAAVCAAAATVCWMELPETVGRGLPEHLPRMHRDAPTCVRLLRLSNSRHRTTIPKIREHSVEALTMSVANDAKGEHCSA